MICTDPLESMSRTKVGIFDQNLCLSHRHATALLWTVINFLRVCMRQGRRSDPGSTIAEWLM